ncbi:MAG: hypothetical protein WC174_05955, partial [Bacilli bacterium]
LIILLVIVSIALLCYIFNPFNLFVHGKDINIDVYVGNIYVSNDGLYILQFNNDHEALFQKNKYVDSKLTYDVTYSFEYTYSDGFVNCSDNTFDVLAIDDNSLWLVCYKEFAYKYGGIDNE